MLLQVQRVTPASQEEPKEYCLGLGPINILGHSRMRSKGSLTDASWVAVAVGFQCFVACPHTSAVFGKLASCRASQGASSAVPAAKTLGFELGCASLSGVF